MVTEQKISTNPKDSIGRSKPSPSLLPSALVLNVAQVMRLGEKKYGPFNWRVEKVSLQVYIDAAMRHLLQYFDGEELDPESGVSHTAHVAACMGIILDAEATGNLLDDRPTKGAASELIRKFTEANSAASFTKAKTAAFPRFFYQARTDRFTECIRVFVSGTVGRSFFTDGYGWSSSMNWAMPAILTETERGLSREVSALEAVQKGLPNILFEWPRALLEAWPGGPSRIPSTLTPIPRFVSSDGKAEKEVLRND